MKAKTRVYIVSSGPGQPRLVRAYSSVQARSYIAEELFKVEVATQDSLIAALTSGLKVEDAAKPENVDAFQQSANGAGDSKSDPYLEGIVNAEAQ